MSPTVIVSNMTDSLKVWWDESGGSDKYPNNKFDVAVFDSAYNEVMRFDDVDYEEEYNSDLGKTGYVYIFDQEDLKNELIERGYGCNTTVYISVAASRSETLITTGPYYSSYQPVTINASQHNYSKYEKYDDSYHVKICQGCGEHENDNNKTSHNFVSYTRYDKTYHIGTCQKCGYQKKAMHYARINDSDSGSLKRCADCGSPLDSGGIFPVTPFEFEDTSENE